MLSIQTIKCYLCYNEMLFMSILDYFHFDCTIQKLAEYTIIPEVGSINNSTIAFFWSVCRLCSGLLLMHFILDQNARCARYESYMSINNSFSLRT